MSLNFEDRIFTHAEAARLSGLTPRQLAVWQDRDLLPGIGEMHRSGRRFYSAADVLQLALIGDIVATSQAGPSGAWIIAKQLVEKLPGMFAKAAGDAIVAVGTGGTDPRYDFLAAADAASIISGSRLAGPFVVLPVSDRLAEITRAVAEIDAADASEAADEAAGRALAAFVEAFQKGFEDPEGGA